MIAMAVHITPTNNFKVFLGFFYKFWSILAIDLFLIM